MSDKIKIPVQMCNYAVKYNLERELQLFVLMKLMFPDGKPELTSYDISFISFVLLTHRKTVKRRIDKLQILGWIFYDKPYGYWRLKGLDRLRYENDWTLCRAVEFNFENLHQIKAVLGAALFTQLYLNHRKRFYRNRSNVLLKDSADKSPVLKEQRTWAAVSISGAAKIFEVSPSKSHRLKFLAIEHGYIKVKHQNLKIPAEQVYAIQAGAKFNDKHAPILQFNGNHYLASIDLISCDFHFKKRTKLKSL